MDATSRLAAYLSSCADCTGKMVDLDAHDRLYRFDLTASNTELGAETYTDTQKFSAWINRTLKENNCRYGIGGYMEHRNIYSRSPHFDTCEEPRRLHLGVDIWAAAGTPVYSPLDGTIHSFQDNDNFGDYGPTIIIQHVLDGFTLFSLYGHLSRKSLQGLKVGGTVKKNQQIAIFGKSTENGNWPPHLHFQLMIDMQDKSGDYPGVAKFSEKVLWLQNIPNPQLILQFGKAVND